LKLDIELKKFIRLWILVLNPLWYSNLAGAHQGRGGCDAVVSKLEGSGKRPNSGVPVPSQKRNALRGWKLVRLSGEKDRLKQEPS
jgi:hypothetical protein